MRLVALALLGLWACDPGPRADDPDAACVANAERCGDAIDNDCDGLTDCRDPDCSGVDGCPACGTVSHPLGEPFPLPDGAGGGGPTGSYESKLSFTGFPVPLTFDQPRNLVSVCVNMEHSWLRDLQIELVAPSGQVLVMQEFLGRTGDEVFMGAPNDSDEVDPRPGMGTDYCWVPVSLRPSMLIYANLVAPSSHLDLPSGDYATARPVANLFGTGFNGDWTLRVTDHWGGDNGYIFAWAISFDPMLVQDCSTPPIQ